MVVTHASPSSKRKEKERRQNRSATGATSRACRDGAPFRRLQDDAVESHLVGFSVRRSNRPDACVSCRFCLLSGQRDGAHLRPCPLALYRRRRAQGRACLCLRLCRRGRIRGHGELRSPEEGSVIVRAQGCCPWPALLSIALFSSQKKF